MQSAYPHSRPRIRSRDNVGVLTPVHVSEIIEEKNLDYL